jgi:Transposase DDE domain group 1
VPRYHVSPVVTLQRLGALRVHASNWPRAPLGRPICPVMFWTAEQWIKEGKDAVTWTRLSCQSFKANTVRLQRHASAYNLANFLRTLAPPAEMAPWFMTSSATGW